MSFVPDKTKMRDPHGNWVTQGLFYDHNYDHKYAMYVLSWEDKTVDGIYYPSIKRLYLEMADPTEYEFATTYFLNWDHWNRICNNKVLRADVDKWREELELKLRSKGAKKMLKMAEEGNFNATKWVTDKGWAGARGRPSKEERKRELEKETRFAKELEDEAGRVVEFLKRKA